MVRQAVINDSKDTRGLRGPSSLLPRHTAWNSWDEVTCPEASHGQVAYPRLLCSLSLGSIC